MELILNFIKPLLESFAGSNGVVLQVISVIGTLRLLMKPIMTLIQAVVDVTPTQSDNEWLNKFMQSKVYLTIVYLLDWFGSIKLPK